LLRKPKNNPARANYFSAGPTCAILFTSDS
jgi:hypothetical protein